MGVQQHFRTMSNSSASLRRIRADLRELSLDPSDRYVAAPLEHDMLEWHFTIRGADGTDFAGGIYHGRILLPPDYPYKPPHILFLTPTGRFETHTKICLSFSAYHPELWQPAWGIRLILEALIAFLPTPADGAIGALDWSAAERKKLAVASRDFFCPTCQCRVCTLLPEAAAPVGTGLRFQKEIQELQRLQFLEHPKQDEEGTEIANDAAKVETSHDAAAMVSEPPMSPVEPVLERPVDPGVRETAEMDPPTGNESIAAISTEESVRAMEEDAMKPSWPWLDRAMGAVLILLAALCAVLLYRLHGLLLEVRDIHRVFDAPSFLEFIRSMEK
jgi:ubiquitin-conjugating enzyme E2 J1